MPEPIFEAGPVDTPYAYTVSGTGTVTPRACQAVFDGTNASGDFVPACIFKSQSGHVISRAILQSTITAGDDAEVSWFPGVKAAASGGGSTLGVATYNTDASGKTYAAGTHNITFTSLATNAPGTFSIDGGDPTIYTISAAGFFACWGEIEFVADIPVTTDTILQVTGPVSAVASQTFDQLSASATHSPLLGHMSGVSFLNVAFPPRSGRFQLVNGQSLANCNGAGFTIWQLSTTAVA